MSTAIRVSDKLVKEARLVSAVDNRSVTGQIEHWAKIGQEKKGEVGGVYVHEFKLHATQYLLSYRFAADTLALTRGFYLP